jgi:hypothetical protein
MTPEHVKALLPILKAYAEGKTIQYDTNGNGKVPNWVDQLGPRGVHFDDTANRYRIKPNTVKYRRYLYRVLGIGTNVGVSQTQENTETVEMSQYFIRWIDTEWQEVEV